MISSIGGFIRSPSINSLKNIYRQVEYNCDCKTFWAINTVAFAAFEWYSQPSYSTYQLLNEEMVFPVVALGTGWMLRDDMQPPNNVYYWASSLNLFQYVFGPLKSAICLNLFLAGRTLLCPKLQSIRKVDPVPYKEPHPNLETISSELSVYQKMSSFVFGSSQKLSLEKMMVLLDKHIVGQTNAKKTITQAIYFHFMQIDNVDLPKGNVLLVGPSGSGKTFIVETISKGLDIPMATLDISRVTPEGYLGPKFIDVFHLLLRSADGDVEKASRGIVFIDEIDKQFKEDAKEKSDHGFKNSGQALLNQLLCTLQGCDIHLPPADRNGVPVIINTKNILFIFAGAFHDLTSTIGEGTLTEEQLLSNGVRPEFLGRIGYISQLSQLSRDEVKEIFVHGPKAVVPSWEKTFAHYGYQLKISDRKMNELIDEALTKPTGARGVHFTLRRLLSPLLADIVLKVEKNPLKIFSENLEVIEI
jgi:ATP-dependent Clp protease ATP-binding subunit ClpX